MKEALRALIGHPGVWFGDGRGGPCREVVPTGRASLDALLPGGGWPKGAVTEILLPCEGIGELRLLVPALVRVAAEGGRIALAGPPHVPYAPALAAAGIGLSRLVLVRAESARDRLWAAEQCLRSGACGAVLAWAADCSDRDLRRLQLAAEKGGCTGFLFSLPAAVARPSPLPLRLRLAPSPAGVVVEIVKGRGREGRKVEVLLEGPQGCRRAGDAPSPHEKIRGEASA